MPVVILRRRKTKPHQDGRPSECPYCGSEVFQRWGEVKKSIKDKDLDDISFYRYRCEKCNRTFREYPEGIDRSYYSLGTKQLAGLIWALGYSYRDIVDLFRQYQVNLSRSTVWREGQVLASKLKEVKLQKYRQIYTIDQNYIHKISPQLGVVIAVEIGGGQYAILGTLNEFDPRSVQDWLNPLIQDAEIEVLLLETGKLDLLYNEETINTEQLEA